LSTESAIRKEGKLKVMVWSNSVSKIISHRDMPTTTNLGEAGGGDQGVYRGGGD